MDLLLRHLRRVAYLHEQDCLTDGQLLEQFLSQRAESAFEALLRRHGPMILGVCRRLLHNDADAEDAFQATFLVLVRKAESVRPRESVGHWLYGVAYRTAMRAKALEAKRRMKEKAMPRPQVQPEGIWQEVLPLLDQELQGLPEKYRSAVVVCDLEGKSRKEAARALGCPEGTLSSRLVRGRALLARRLSRRGVAIGSGLLASLMTAGTARACVPASLVTGTMKAAMAVGHASATACLSLKVSTLTQGVLKSVLLLKLKTVTFLLCGVVALGIGTGSMLYQAHGGAIYSNQASAAEDPGGSRPGGDERKGEDDRQKAKEADPRRPKVTTELAQQIEAGIGKMSEAEAIKLLPVGYRLESGKPKADWKITCRETTEIRLEFVDGKLASRSASFNPSVKSKNLTTQHFRSLKNGMTLNEVVTVLGNQNHEPVAAGKDDQNRRVETWCWVHGRELRITVTDGIVTGCWHTAYTEN
jgi:RNA polymerase sigma factor (sigma-70 family)